MEIRFRKSMRFLSLAKTVQSSGEERERERVTLMEKQEH